MGNTKAWVISCQLLSIVAWVQSHVSLCGICCGQSGIPSTQVSPANSHSPDALFLYLLYWAGIVIH
jgi:hypothetical protein